MVLSTQVKAPHSAYGAIEVAASYMRGGNGFPFPLDKNGIPYEIVDLTQDTEALELVRSLGLPPGAPRGRRRQALVRVSPRPDRRPHRV